MHKIVSYLGVGIKDNFPRALADLSDNKSRGRDKLIRVETTKSWIRSLRNSQE